MEKCPNNETCPIYKHFVLGTSKEIIVTLFCEGNYEKCQRKNLKDQGEPVPEKLLPDGQYLE